MPAYDEVALDIILQKARQQGIKLLYLFTNSNAVLSSKSVRTYVSRLVDTKRTYGYDLGQAKPIQAVGPIEKFSDKHAIQPLYELAYQSGEYSRFKVDVSIGEENFKRLYRQWIDNSVSGKAADATFVYMSGRSIHGFITIRKNPLVTTIGLMATDMAVRGRGIGSTLLTHVKHHLQSIPAVHLSVVTQKANRTACRFYERNGFVLNNEVNVFHVWL